MDPFLGEIRIFAGNFAPRDWMFCAGQILSIAQNTALFALLLFTPYWIAFVPGVVLTHRIGVMMHEYIHGIPFRRYAYCHNVLTFFDGLTLMFGLLELFRGRPWPLILGGHTHVAEKLVYRTDRGPLRFEQSAAIVGPNDYGPVLMPSGFSLYTVTDGAIDAGTFVPLTIPRQ